jgi:hypothetical protein
MYSRTAFQQFLLPQFLHLHQYDINAEDSVNLRRTPRSDAAKLS